MDQQKVYKFISDERELVSTKQSFEDWIIDITERLNDALEELDDGFPGEAESKFLQAMAMGVAALEQHGTEE